MEIYLNAKTVFLAAIALAVIFVGFTFVSAFFAMIDNFFTVGSLYK